MIIRQFTPPDLRFAVPLYLEVFNAPPWNDGWTQSGASERLRRLVESPHGYGVIALQDEAPVGFVLGLLEFWTQGEELWLKEMCVRPQLQRSGVGTAMLDYLSLDLAEKGVQDIILQTHPEGAAAFYEKNGFREHNLSTMTLSLAGRSRL